MNDLHRSMILDKLARMKARHPVVLRFAEMFPSALARYEMHAARKGGNLDHIDPERSGSNCLLIGDPDWREKLEQEIAAVAAENFAEEAEALVRRKRAKELRMLQFRGVTDPWKDSAGGPLREVILTAHRDWFTGQDQGATATRAQRFEAQAVEWLQSRFGDAVVHARADHDEMTYHIHAILAPWVEKTSVRRGKQRLLQPSSNKFLKDYEAAQDDVGEFFEHIGLRRGQRTAAARRAVKKAIKAREERRAKLTASGQHIPDALSEDHDPLLPVTPQHVPTPVWWADEKQRLADDDRKLASERARLVAEAQDLEASRAAVEDREAAVAEREQEVVNVIDIVEAVVSGTGVEEAKVRFGLSPLAARFATAMKTVQARMAQRAEERARKMVEAELSAAVSFREKAETLFDQLKTLLPAVMRGQFDKVFGPAVSGVRDAERGARKDPKSGRGDER